MRYSELRQTQNLPGVANWKSFLSVLLLGVAESVLVTMRCFLHGSPKDCETYFYKNLETEGRENLDRGLICHS